MSLGRSSLRMFFRIFLSFAPGTARGARVLPESRHPPSSASQPHIWVGRSKAPAVDDVDPAGCAACELVSKPRGSLSFQNGARPRCSHTLCLSSTAPCAWALTSRRTPGIAASTATGSHAVLQLVSTLTTSLGMPQLFSLVPSTTRTSRARKPPHANLARLATLRGWVGQIPRADQRIATIRVCIHGWRTAEHYPPKCYSQIVRMHAEFGTRIPSDCK